MTMRRWMWIFVAIALGSFALAAAGRFLLAWPQGAIGTWVGIGAGYLFGALLFLLVPRWWRQHCDEMYAQPAGRRYMRAMWPIMIGYSLLLFASMWLIKRGIEPLALKAPLVMHSAIGLALMSFAFMSVGLVAWLWLHRRWREIG